VAIAVTKAGPSLNIKEKHQALPYFKFSLRVTCHSQPHAVSNQYSYQNVVLCCDKTL